MGSHIKTANMKGRKPLPTEVKRVKGTLQKCRTRDDEMQPPLVEDMPPPPDYLDEVGKKEWNHIIPQLKAGKVLAVSDLALVAMYCNEIATYIECQNQMRRAATRVMVLKDDQGKVRYAQQVPYQKIANEALERALKISVEFGFTPAARTRIGVKDKKPEASAILAAMQGGLKKAQ